MIHFLHRSWRYVLSLLRIRFVRYLIVGGSSFVLQAGTYALLSRLVWPEGNRQLQNFLSICLTVVFNFFAQRNWTFQAQGAYFHHMGKYLFGVVTATLLQSALFWIGHSYFKVYDLLVIFMVGTLMAVYTYTIHRYFTFRAPRVRA